MKKIFIFLFALFITQLSVFADYEDFYYGKIEYNWDKITQTERDSSIAQIYSVLFGNECVIKYQKKEFKSQFKDLLKDKLVKEHYYAAAAGRKEWGNVNLAAFYGPKSTRMYMYGIQYKDDLLKNYYYDALGHLQYVDYIYGPYPDYPYYSRQYRINGKLVGAIYFVAKDCQYVFTPKGEFKGLWLKKNFYDKDAKIIMKRTNY